MAGSNSTLMFDGNSFIIDATKTLGDSIDALRKHGHNVPLPRDLMLSGKKRRPLGHSNKPEIGEYVVAKRKSGKNMNDGELNLRNRNQSRVKRID